MNNPPTDSRRDAETQSNTSASAPLRLCATKDRLIAFEDRIKAHWEAGNLPCLLHLCGGNEDQLIAIFKDIRPGDWVFSTHRNHYHALLAGMPADELEAAILEGRSMFSFRRARMQEGFDPAYDGMWDGAHLYSSAILAGTCAIAAGVAYACRWNRHPHAHLAPKVWCFLGDGAEEEGHFYEAALFVEAHNLPCTFIIEDNNRQVDTDKASRRGSVQYENGNIRRNHAPLDAFRCVKRYHYTPTYPHAGSGAKPGTISFRPEAIERMRACCNS